MRNLLDKFINSKAMNFINTHIDRLLIVLLHCYIAILLGTLGQFVLTGVWVVLTILHVVILILEIHTKEEE